MESVVALAIGTASRGKELAKELGELTCWGKAYLDLESTCGEILKDEEKKVRFALELSNCFLERSGRRSFPCPQLTPVRECTAALDREGLATYRSFFLDCTSMCYFLQSAAFNQATERLVNELRDAAEVAEGQLSSLSGNFENMLAKTEKVQESLGEISQAHKELLGHQIDVAETLKASLETSLQGQQDLLKGQRASVAAMNRLQEVQALAAAAMEQHHRDEASRYTEVAAWHNKFLMDQELLESKLKDIVGSVDRVLALYRLMAVESQMLSLLAFHVAAAVFLAIVTSLPRMAAAWPILVCGLLLNLMAEVAAVSWRTFGPDPEHAKRGFLWTRTAAAGLGACVLLHAAIVYRDYAALTFQLVQQQRQQLQDSVSQLLRQAMMTVVEVRQLQPRRSMSAMMAPGTEMAIWNGYQDSGSGAAAAALDGGAEDDDDDDPDYVPPEHHLWQQQRQRDGTVKRYYLRQSVRRRGRRLPSCASFLEWETVDDFVRLVTVNGSTANSSKTTDHVDATLIHDFQDGLESRSTQAMHS